MELWYDLFGRTLMLRSKNRELISFIRRMESAWGRLACPPAPRADIEVDILCETEGSPLRHVQDFANDRFFVHTSRHRLITGHCFRRPWQVHIRSYANDIPRTAHGMVAPAVLSLVERCGLSTLHAAAVADRGRGVLLAGDTGSGKSTTAFALIAQGFDFITDNDVYLEPGRTGVKVRSRGGSIGIRHQTSRRVTGLPPFAHFPISGEGRHRKHRIDPARIRPRAAVPATPIRLLLFPGVGRRVSCGIRAMQPADALQRLLASYPLGGSLRAVMKDTHAQRGRFERLSLLVASAPAYTLTLGSDVTSIGPQIRSLLA